MAPVLKNRYNTSPYGPAHGCSPSLGRLLPHRLQPDCLQGPAPHQPWDCPLAVAHASDVVFLIVGYTADVRRVALDPATGVLPGLSPGSVLVDMTTSDPALAADIASAAASTGCAAVDAPVSGGDRGARAGTLSIFAGGEEVVVRRLEPLFRCMGTVRYMGGPGAGQRAKLGNQIAIASTMVGLVERVVYAHKAGLDVGKWLEAISTGQRGRNRCQRPRHLFEGMPEHGPGPAGIGTRAAALRIANGPWRGWFGDTGVDSVHREAQQYLPQVRVGVRLSSGNIHPAFLIMNNLSRLDCVCKLK